MSKNVRMHAILFMYHNNLLSENNKNYPSKYLRDLLLTLTQNIGYYLLKIKKLRIVYTQVFLLLVINV